MSTKGRAGAGGKGQRNSPVRVATLPFTLPFITETVGASKYGGARGGAAWHRAISSEVNVPESATLADAEKAASSMFVDNPVRNWTLVDELGVGHPVQLAINDFLEVRLQRVETSVLPGEQPEVLWEKDD
jgi:hypothetical protein